MNFETIIKNGTIVTATDTFAAEIGITGETIAAIGRGLPVDGARIIDAAGCMVMPGGIDVHTHLDMPFGGTFSADDFESGHIAAAYGGTTAHVDFSIQFKGQSLHTAIETWHKKAAGKAVIDYGFHCIVTDLSGNQLNEIPELVKQGVTSIKLFLAYPGVFMVDDATIFRTMQQAAKCGALIMVHAENGPAIDILVKQAVAAGQLSPKFHALTRPPELEGEATARALTLGEIAGTAVYIVHVTCQQAKDAVRAARQRGARAHGETCIQYLYLDITSFDAPGFEGAKYVFTPPLRPKWHQAELWDALVKDDLQVVSTDHCPFNFKGQKDLGKDDFTKIPNGGPAIEDRLTLLYTGGVHGGRFSANRFVDLVSTKPAKIFGMYPRKGTLAPGSDADIVIWDPNEERTISARTHHMRVDYSMFEGIRTKGAAKTVLCRGKTLIENSKFVGRAGMGKFIARAPYSNI